MASALACLSVVYVAFSNSSFIVKIGSIHFCLNCQHSQPKNNVYLNEGCLNTGLACSGKLQLIRPDCEYCS